MSQGRVQVSDFVLRATQVLIVAPALMVGTVHPATRGAVFGAILAVGAVYLVDSVFRKRHLPLPPLALLLAAIAGFTLVQALPLGRTVQSLLGGAQAGRVQDTLALIGVGSPWHSLSPEPVATLTWAVVLWGLAVFLVVTSRLAVRPERAQSLLRAVAFAGLAVLITGIVNVVVGPTDLFHLYPSPLAQRTGFHTTLLNANHSAGLMNLSAFVFLGLAMDAGATRPRILWTLGFLAMSGGSLAAGSRGGSATLLVLLAAFAAWHSIGPTLRAARPAIRVLAGMLLALMLPLSLALLEAGLRHFFGTSLGPDHWEGKTGIWPAAVELILDHPWAGVGPGSFPAVITHYNRFFPDLTFHFVENAPLQILADWGIPFGVAILGLSGYLVVRLIVAGSDWTLGQAAGFGVLALVVQNLADFSLALPGVAIPAIAVLGVLAGRHAKRNGSGTRRTPPIRARAVYIFLLPVIGSGIVLGAGPFLDTRAARERLADSDIGKGTANPGAVSDLLASEARLHPHDAHLLVQGARLLMESGDESGAERILEQALVLSPFSEAAARLLATLRVRTGRVDEAIPLFQGLLDAHPSRAGRTFDLVGSTLGPANVVAVLADRPGALKRYVNHTARRGNARDLERLHRAILAVMPDNGGSLEGLARLLVARDDLDEADRLVTRLLAQHPGNEAGPLLQGRIFARRNALLEALAMFTEAASMARFPGEAEVAVMNTLLLLERFDAFDARVESSSRRIAGNRYWQCRLLMSRSSRARKIPDTAAAIDALDRAERLCPDDAEPSLQKARLLTREGMLREAERAWERARRLDPDNQEMLEALKQKSEAEPPKP